jgi:hypothetical protein
MREVGSFRIEPVPSVPGDEGEDDEAVGRVVLVFDHGGRTVRFGGGLGEGEANEILAEVGERFAGKVELPKHPGAEPPG